MKRLTLEYVREKFAERGYTFWGNGIASEDREWWQAFYTEIMRRRGLTNGS